jgi:hypothetical protein
MDLKYFLTHHNILELFLTNPFSDVADGHLTALL